MSSADEEDVAERFMRESRRRRRRLESLLRETRARADESGESSETEESLSNVLVDDNLAAPSNDLQKNDDLFSAATAAHRGGFAASMAQCITNNVLDVYHAGRVSCIYGDGFDDEKTEFVHAAAVKGLTFTDHTFQWALSLATTLEEKDQALRYFSAGNVLTQSILMCITNRNNTQLRDLQRSLKRDESDGMIFGRVDFDIFDIPHGEPPFKPGVIDVSGFHPHQTRSAVSNINAQFRYILAQITSPQAAIQKYTVRYYQGRNPDLKSMPEEIVNILIDLAASFLGRPRALGDVTVSPATLVDRFPHLASGTTDPKAIYKVLQDYPHFREMLRKKLKDSLRDIRHATTSTTGGVTTFKNSKRPRRATDD